LQIFEKVIIVYNQPRGVPTQMQHLKSGIMLVSLAILCSACNQPSESKSKPTQAILAPSQTATSVRAITVNSGILKTSRSVNGTLEPTIDSTIAAQTSGQVISIYHREGSTVQIGEVILKLDDTGLQQQLVDAQLQLKTAQINFRSSQRKAPETTTQSRSSLESAKISWDKAKQTYQANLAVFKIGGVSKTDLDTSKANLAQSEASFKQAQASLAQAERAKSENLALLEIQVAQAQNKIAQTTRSLGQTTVKAAFTGEIAEMFTEVGEFVNTGAKVLRLVDTSSLRARFKIPTQDANTLQTGSSLRIKALGRTLEAKVTRSSQIAGSSRLVETFARLVGNQNTSGFSAGSTIQVEYTLKIAQGVLVPTGALQTNSGQTYVYLVKDSTAVQRKVNVLGESGGQVAITGVEAGTQVVYPVPGSLQSNELIKVLSNPGSPK
jgi:HlyD family secretion protein